MRRQLIEKEEKGLSIRRQCELLSVSRSGLYYQSKTESAENLELMKTIDRIVVAEPSFGILRIQDALEEQDYVELIIVYDYFVKIWWRLTFPKITHLRK